VKVINVKHIILLWLLLVTGSTTVFSASYRQVFGEEWEEAERFVKANHREWTVLFKEFGVDSRMAEAIVFPELIRYSKWQDEIEKAAVNGLYVVKGSTGADFSVGRFQMKPSFAEEVERAWNRSPLAQKHGFAFNTLDNAEARRSRIRRLSTTEGQCRYLALFMLLQYERHGALGKMTPKEQVRHLATIYNRSFTASWDTIVRLTPTRHFHTDIIATGGSERYCYADIAAEAYQTLCR